jgi:hypothetical protein
VRQHVLELGQRAGPGLLDAADAMGGVQPDGHRHRLLVVQQQRWQLGAHPEPVVPAGAARRVDRIAQLAQPLDVVADGTAGDGEPVGQLGAGPAVPGLQQAEQREQSRGGF